MFAPKNHSHSTTQHNTGKRDLSNDLMIMSGVTLRRMQPTNKKTTHSLPFFNNASATTTRRSHQHQQSSRLSRKRHGCDPIKLLILSVVSLCLLMQGGALHWLQQQRLANQPRLRIQPFDPQSLPSWLTNYVRWHQSRLQYNKQTGEYEFHVSKDDDYDYGYGYFQYVCHAEHICGGVGDRIKSALTTHSISAFAPTAAFSWTLTLLLIYSTFSNPTYSIGTPPLFTTTSRPPIRNAVTNATIRPPFGTSIS